MRDTILCSPEEFVGAESNRTSKHLKEVESHIAIPGKGILWVYRGSCSYFKLMGEYWVFYEMHGCSSKWLMVFVNDDKYMRGFGFEVDFMKWDSKANNCINLMFRCLSKWNLLDFKQACRWAG